MKAYGVPRFPERESPDCADITKYAMKGSRGFDKKGTRRRFKKKARREGNDAH